MIQKKCICLKRISGLANIANLSVMLYICIMYLFCWSSDGILGHFFTSGINYVQIDINIINYKPTLCPSYKRTTHEI